VNARHVLESLMDEQFPEGPYLDLEGLPRSFPAELVCPCGDVPYVVAVPSDPLTCPTCGARYLVATRLTLLPIDAHG
jgi:hypothetical protein